MISHKHRCIFIHIPKCAGTSIELALGHYDGYRGKSGQDHRSIRMLERPLLTPKALASIDNFAELLRAAKYPFRRELNPNSKLTVTRRQYESYFKFTFVRNPWARAYSWYRNVMRDPNHRRVHRITGDVSYREFLRRFGGKGSLRPQLHWMRDFSGSIALDFVGRFETLVEDFRQVCEAIGMDPVALPHSMKGSGESYREGYDAESMRLVRDLYREEIEMFGYAFEDEADTRCDPGTASEAEAAPGRAPRMALYAGRA